MDARIDRQGRRRSLTGKWRCFAPAVVMVFEIANPVVAPCRDLVNRSEIMVTSQDTRGDDRARYPMFLALPDLADNLIAR